MSNKIKKQLIKGLFKNVEWKNSMAKVLNNIFKIEQLKIIIKLIFNQSKNFDQKLILIIIIY